MRHIFPHLAIASLMVIQPLCSAGCKATFDKDKCSVMYEGNLILCRYKDKLRICEPSQLMGPASEPPYHDLPQLLIMPHKLE
jgi:hypothetical protein